MADTEMHTSSVVEEMLTSVKVEVHDSHQGEDNKILEDSGSQDENFDESSLQQACEQQQAAYPEAETNGHDPVVMMKTQPSAHSNNKLHDLRTSVEDKSHILSSAWNDLYNLLGEYKAELFSKEIMSQKYEGITDISHLKSELLEKDNEIHDFQRQIEEFRDQNDQVLRINEQSQLDLSVKDSLLKKYQEDLLSKESALLTSNTKISRLENRIRALENRAGQLEPPRKVMRPNMTPGRIIPSAMGRFTPNNSRMSPSSRLLPGSAGRMGGMAGRMTPGSLVRRRMPAAPIQVARAPELTSPRPTPSKQPIVCIEVEDDEEIQEVAKATQQNIPETSMSAGHETSEGMYVESWSEQEQENALQTDATSLESLPGTSAEQYLDVNQALMMDSQPQFPGQDDLGEQPWPIEMSASDLAQLGSSMNQRPQSLVQSPSSNKVLYTGKKRPVIDIEAIVRAILTVKGHTVCITSLQQSGPRPLKRAAGDGCKSEDIRVAYGVMQELGLGVEMNRGLFRKTSPRHLSIEILYRFGCSMDKYLTAYLKPVGKLVAQLMLLENLPYHANH